MRLGSKLSTARPWRQHQWEAHNHSPQSCDDNNHDEEATLADASSRPKLSRFIGHKRTISGTMLRVLKSPSSWSLPRSPLSQTFGPESDVQSQTGLTLHPYPGEILPSVAEGRRSQSSGKLSYCSANDEDLEIHIAHKVHLRHPNDLKVIIIPPGHYAHRTKAHYGAKVAQNVEADNALRQRQSYEQPPPLSSSSSFQHFEKTIEDQFGSDIADDLSHASSTPDRKRDAIWMMPPVSAPSSSSSGSPPPPNPSRSSEVVINLKREVPGTPTASPTSPKASRTAIEDIRRSWAVADQWLTDNGDVQTWAQRHDGDWFLQDTFFSPC